MGHKWMALVTFVLCACSSKSDHKPLPKDARPEPKPTKSADIGPQHFDAPVIELPKQLSFAVLDPGKAPIALLRYAPAPGVAMYHAETSLKSRHLAGGNWGDPTTLPAIRDGFAITASTPKAPFAVRPLPGEVVGKPTNDADQYLATWRSIENRRFSVVLDDRGQLGAITFNDDPTMARSDAAKAELVQRLLATLVPLPEQAVGVGAVWRVTTALRQRPAVVKQSATYTLVARSATTWKIDVKIQRIGESQTITDDALPRGTTAELIVLLRRLEGTVEVDPKRVLPVGKLAVTSTIHLRLTTTDVQHMDEQIFDDTGSVVLTTTEK